MRRVVLCTSKEYAATETARLGVIPKLIAQLGRALDVESKCCGFNSH